MTRFTPIPVTIVTGFLGAGKTTLINWLLKDPALADTAVIVNEFGEVGIDHLLVEASGDGIIELSDGCLCCSVRGELVDTLADLIDRLQTGRIARLDRIVIETTGLADPVPVLQSLMAHPVLMQALRLDGVICVFDAVAGLSMLDGHEEAVRQVAVADAVLVTKTDMAQAIDRRVIADRIATLNPTARLVWDAGGFGAGDLTGLATAASEARLEAVAGDDHGHGHGHDHDGHDHDHAHHHHHHHHHKASIRSFSLTHDAPVDMAAIAMFFDLLRSQQGERILRMKGLVRVTQDEERPVVVHGVGAMLHPPVRMAAWPVGVRGTRLVIIGDGLDETYVQRIFDAFLNQAAIDTPDRAALEANPLAIPGVRGI